MTDVLLAAGAAHRYGSTRALAGPDLVPKLRCDGVWTATTGGRPVESVLSCDGLERSFGDLKAVDGVGFHVAAGETYGLLGPNGAGKTSSISMVAGLLEPDAGTIVVAGERMDPRASKAKRHVGLVPQELSIYPDLTGRENLDFFARLYGLDRDQRGRRVDQILEVIGLTDRAGGRAGEYSGGMKRRLNIGIGMLHDPQLLILDEPTVGVDPQSRNAILESVEALATEGMSVLYTTHYMEEAERLCDRIGIIDQGRLVAEGTRRELVATIGEQDLVRLRVSGDASEAAEYCQRVEGVTQVDAEDETVVCLLDEAATRLPALLAAVGQSRADVIGVEVKEPDLEDVFLHLTGRALRD
jgi:ABC-2 type transport system ATP-binding protein